MIFWEAKLLSEFPMKGTEAPACDRPSELEDLSRETARLHQRVARWNRDVEEHFARLRNRNPQRVTQGTEANGSTRREKVGPRRPEEARSQAS
jgi:hypothetical protein